MYGDSIKNLVYQDRLWLPPVPETGIEAWMPSALPDNFFGIDRVPPPIPQFSIEERINIEAVNLIKRGYSWTHLFLSSENYDDVMDIISTKFVESDTLGCENLMMNIQGVETKIICCDYLDNDQLAFSDIK
jgi:hypothetical protein